MGEWKEVQSLFMENNLPEQICKSRTEYAMRWYIKRANVNKWIYYCFSFIGMLCPLVNAVLAVCMECKVTTVLLSSITSFATSTLAITNARSKWENYRSAAEFLKREYTLFQAKVGVYNEDQRTSVYLQTIEDFMQKVHINWQKIFEKDASKKKSEKDQQGN